MAETVEQAGAPEGAAKKGGRTKLLVLAAAVLLVLAAAGGGAAWWLGFFSSSPASAEEGTAAGPAAVEHAAATEEGEESDGHVADAAGVAFVDLPDVVVNLHATGSRMRFLKLRISLEVGSDREAEELRVLTPRVMDSFQLYLRALTADDVQGAAGMQRLKEEMLARVLRAVEPTQITDVLIKEMLVQ